MMKVSIKPLKLGTAMAAMGILMAAYTPASTTNVSAAANANIPLATTQRCLSATPCLSVRNDGDGIAIFGQAKNNHSIEGVTRYNNSSSSTNGYVAVLGFDEATSSNDVNYGVAGVSSNSTGVVGVTNNSRSGNILEAGVFGYDGATKANGNVGVFGGSGYNLGVIGQSSQSTGVYGESLYSYGVFAYALNSSTSALGIESVFGSRILQAFNGSKEVAELDNKGDLVIAGNIQTGGTPMSVTRTSQGRSLLTYAPKETEATVEDVGEARLIRGLAYVRIDPTFASTMDLHRPYLVFITPQGDAANLYVTQKTSSGFIVREHNGVSNIAFDFRIVAKPFGAGATRLPFAGGLSQPSPRSPALTPRKLPLQVLSRLGQH